MKLKLASEATSFSTKDADYDFDEASMLASIN